MVKRYEFEEGNRGYPCAVECDNGGYVDYDDHAAELATLRAENDRLRYALNAVVATSGKKVFFEEGYKCYDPIQIAKEALK